MRKSAPSKSPARTFSKPAARKSSKPAARKPAPRRVKASALQLSPRCPRCGGRVANDALTALAIVHDDLRIALYSMRDGFDDGDVSAETLHDDTAVELDSILLVLECMASGQHGKPGRRIDIDEAAVQKHLASLIAAHRNPKR